MSFLSFLNLLLREFVRFLIRIILLRLLLILNTSVFLHQNFSQSSIVDTQHLLRIQFSTTQRNHHFTWHFNTNLTEILCKAIIQFLVFTCSRCFEVNCKNSNAFIPENSRTLTICDRFSTISLVGNAVP